MSRMPCRRSRVETMSRSFCPSAGCQHLGLQPLGSIEWGERTTAFAEESFETRDQSDGH